MMIVDTIKNTLKFFNIKTDINVNAFSEYRKISTRAKGIYIIIQGNTVVYVGKGNIRARQVHHWNKANNIIKPGTQDPDGWKWLREHVDIYPATWTIYHLELYKETEKSAVEGALIHLLQPLANDETFRDRRTELVNS
jgi:hypothetical protein